MSRSGSTEGKTLKLFSSESLPNRFEGDKPDTKECSAVTCTINSSTSSSDSSGKLTPSSIGGEVLSSATSPITNFLPVGNICPSGKIGKMGNVNRSVLRTEVLGSGTANYGHGSILRGGSFSTGMRFDAEEATKAGNDHYKKGKLAEALRFYHRAVEMCPRNAACWNNRAAAFSGLGRLQEAVKDCEEAVRIDPSYGKAHHRLSGLYLRLGQVESARRHLLLVGNQPDHTKMLKFQTVERHLRICSEFRSMGDWKSSLSEADSLITAGADSSPLIITLRAEALLRLHHLVEADTTLSKALKYEIGSSLPPHCKFLGMLSNSYIFFVQAQVEMAFGRFGNAVASIEKARQLDPCNVEVSVMRSNVNSVTRARSRGNELFKSGNFSDACIAYSEGLKYDPSNSVLFCNRAACHFKLGSWERSLEDCNKALRIHPSYIKALLRRAASYAKLERWIEAVRDYEVLRRELPADIEIAEAFSHAEAALNAPRSEEVCSMKFGGEVEKITSLKQLQEAISLTGVSVIYFLSASNHHCAQTTPFVESLCARFSSLNFMKVEVMENPNIAKVENVRIVPTIRIYKNGVRVKEMICPRQKILEFSLQHYGI